MSSKQTAQSQHVATISTTMIRVRGYFARRKIRQLAKQLTKQHTPRYRPLIFTNIKVTLRISLNYETSLHSFFLLEAFFKYHFLFFKYIFCQRRNSVTLKRN